MSQIPVCLTIGGSDSCGGAGIQADLRMFADAGVQGCSAMTALTAQNPAQVTRIEPVSLAQLDAELHALFDYYDVAAVKTGMLLDAEHIALLAAFLDLHHVQKPLIIDPVMISSSGRRLLDVGAVDTLVKALMPQATLITPNLDEAAELLGQELGDDEQAAKLLMQQLGCAVLLKGGHADGELLKDVLALTDGSVHIFEHPKQTWNTDQLHGTGCRLSAMITARIAQGGELREACETAIQQLQEQSL